MPKYLCYPPTPGTDMSFGLEMEVHFCAVSVAVSGWKGVSLRGTHLGRMTTVTPSPPWPSETDTAILYCETWSSLPAPQKTAILNEAFLPSADFPCNSLTLLLPKQPLPLSRMLSDSALNTGKTLTTQGQSSPVFMQQTASPGPNMSSFTERPKC